MLKNSDLGLSKGCLRLALKCCSKGRIQKIQKEGAVSLPFPPRNENFTFQGIQHFERIRDAKESKINVSKHRIKELFLKRLSKQNRTVSG